MTLTATSSLQTKYVLDGVVAAYRGTFVAAGQQVTDAPAGYRNSVKFTVSTAQGSPGASDELSVLMPIEGVRASRLALGTASAASTSFAFWVKAHRTGTYSGSLRNSAKNRSYPFTFAVSAADTWEFKTVTVSGDTSGAWLNDTGVGIYLNICIAGGASRVGTAGAWAGSDYSGVTGTTNGLAATTDTFQVTGLIVLPGIELPASDRAPFIMRPFEQELMLCKRHLQRIPGMAAAANVLLGVGQAYSTTNAVAYLQYACEMRAAPTLAVSSAAHFSAVDATFSTAIAATALSLAYTGLDRTRLSVTVASGLAAGNATMILSNTTSATLDLNARL